MPTTETLERPLRVGDWDLEKTQQMLGRPIPQALLKTKIVQGNKIPYLPWYTVVDILNTRLGGLE